MFKYFQTTTLILMWCFGMTWIWCYTSYRILSHKNASSDSAAMRSKQVLVPGLVLGPMLLVLAYRWFGSNLLFPVHFFSNIIDVAKSAFAPALILCLASGVFGAIRRNVQREYLFWQKKTFATVAMAMGLNPLSSLRRLVILQSLTKAWGQCLPWLFGELIVVEAVFNAPGLGLDAWHMARVRDFPSLLEVISWLALLYGTCVLMTAIASHWIGKRLESYT